MNSADTGTAGAPRLLTARVLRVTEQHCEIWHDGRAVVVPFAPMMPAPRVERVSPGHRVAVATSPTGTQMAVWRWYDAVVLGGSGDGSVLLWEPAHGEVTARPRPSYSPVEPGRRAWASAGLPGADWWVAGSVTPAAGKADGDVDAELDAVRALYTEYGMWPAGFANDA